MFEELKKFKRKKVDFPLPNFVRLQHEKDRENLYSLPGMGILPFKAKDLHSDEMNQILYELEDYEQHHNRLSQLFNTELIYRKDENSCNN